MHQHDVHDSAAARIRIHAEPMSAERPRGRAALWVHCPRVQAPKSLSDCALCDLCREIHLDPAKGGSYLVCRPVAAREERPWHQRSGAAQPAINLETPVSEVMTKSVTTVQQDDHVEEVAGMFLDRHISGAPVLDDKRRLVGIVSKTDLLREFYELSGELIAEREPLEDLDDALEEGFHVDRARKTTVKDVMMPVTFSIREDTSIAQAAALMAYEGFHRVPVLSERGESIVGLVSSLDILRWVAAQDGYLTDSTSGT